MTDADFTEYMLKINSTLGDATMPIGGLGQTLAGRGAPPPGGVLNKKRVPERNATATTETGGGGLADRLGPLEDAVVHEDFPHEEVLGSRGSRPAPKGIRSRSPDELSELLPLDSDESRTRPPHASY